MRYVWIGLGIAALLVSFVLPAGPFLPVEYDQDFCSAFSQ